MKKLPLPSPHSPKGLDEKILAYAKQKQPKKKPYRPSLWVSGLATASIVLVTVMIALPTQKKVGSAGTELVRPAASPTKATLSTAKSPNREERSVERYEMAAEAANALSALPALVADEADQNLDASSIHHRLELLADQLKNGNSTQARLNYQALKRQCPECDFPATLEQALEKHDPGN